MSKQVLSERAHEIVVEMVKLQLDLVDFHLALSEPKPNHETFVIAGNQMLDLAQISLGFGMSQEFAKALHDLGGVLLYITNPPVFKRDYQKAKEVYLSTFEPKKGLYEMDKIFYVYLINGELEISSTVHKFDAPMFSGTRSDCETYVKNNPLF